MTETDLTTEYTDLTLIISYHQQIFQQINQVTNTIIQNFFKGSDSNKAQLTEKLNGAYYNKISEYQKQYQIKYINKDKLTKQKPKINPNLNEVLNEKIRVLAGVFLNKNNITKVKDLERKVKPKEKKALYNLILNQNIVITQTDKNLGLATTKYIKAVKNLLNLQDYEEINNMEESCINIIQNQILNLTMTIENWHNNYFLSEKTQLPFFYTLPKESDDGYWSWSKLCKGKSRTVTALPSLSPRITEPGIPGWLLRTSRTG
ncbi:hypothetical protein C2G38_2158539 [Gigaspora rosea]|uniref:Uncharacterized protein n=1 Tax=Gigaspora rosea TaxID=44941 RepID=A0A397W7D0_9GLOM|nr:hypothetical protein C2G38_2158539 [Gigaspora rosea]